MVVGYDGGGGGGGGVLISVDHSLLVKGLTLATCTCD